MNLIQENSDEVQYFTILRDVEKWMELDFEDYDWHFAEVEANWGSEDAPFWISGEELKSRFFGTNCQFFWAVISAFPKSTPPRLYQDVFAESPHFWEGTPKKQIKESLFELVCWDSSATIWIGLSDELAERVLKNAPGVEDLDSVIARIKRR